MMLFAVFAGLILLLLTGIPIFAALGLTASTILLLVEGDIDGLGDAVYAHLNKPILATIPLFVFMAQVMIRAKVIDDLYTFAHTVIGHIRGGLGVATVLACTIFAAISGSSVATALSIGSSAIPQMKRFGYPERDALGVVAAGGTLGILIPPSGPMILYAIVSEASIGALFLAGIVPGLLLALMFSVWCMIQARARQGIDAPEWAGWARATQALRRSIWALLAPPVVMGGIYFGVFTASEAAAAGSLYALIVAVLVYRNFGFGDLWHCAVQTMRTSMMVFMIIAGAAMFGHAITLIRLPVGVTEAVAGLGLGPIGFLLMVMALIFVLGMFLESIAIILITTPILLPTMMALGIDPIWYGVLLMINLELAMITPPVGMNLFVIKGITDAPLSAIVRGAAPFVVIMIAGLALLIAVPGLATWLPVAAGFGR
ncbi:TRAP transporter large permease [Arenibacterium halophilum]|jgi:C4-dicarboxylate transporter DctM subunit|uniref:TRAP transporter large permease protein n=1 Tax=Arenibacterium halophilum TaxID=2583821 RepID=A0ABY2X771_9RHOB|nr:TRAP transporter large permease [Arenibacterium halophilum]MAY89165.1 C4-dicarboxylate ABC transporter [Pseudooceanicola sp.]TMV11633.1 TRAP transporter large permease [Arenibacterium halophilum]